MKLKGPSSRNFLFEFISIFFAVFLGLMLNQWKDHRNNEQLAEQSQRNILTEVLSNQKILKELLEEHTNGMLIVDSALQVIESTGEDVDISIDLMFQMISSTSWETAKLTQAIVYMDIELVDDIAGIYNFQAYYETVVKDYAMKSIYNRPTDLDLEYVRTAKRFLSTIITLETALVDSYEQLQNETLDE